MNKITKTIRFPKELNNKICKAIENENKINNKKYSFNSFVHSACEFALKNLSDESNIK